MPSFHALSKIVPSESLGSINILLDERSAMGERKEIVSSLFQFGTTAEGNYDDAHVHSFQKLIDHVKSMKMKSNDMFREVYCRYAC